MLESSLGAAQPEAQEHPWEMRQPVGTGGAGLEGLLELSLTPLRHVFGMRMVGGGEGCLGAEKAEPTVLNRTEGRGPR